MLQQSAVSMYILVGNGLNMYCSLSVAGIRSDSQLGRNTFLAWPKCSSEICSYWCLILYMCVERWSKHSTILILKDERGPSSLTRTLEPYQKQHKGNIWETWWSAYALFRADIYYLELKWTVYVSVVISLDVYAYAQKYHLQYLWLYSSMFRAPDSWLKGRRFESLQERRENFLLRGQLSVLTYFGISSTPVLPR